MNIYRYICLAALPLLFSCGQVSRHEKTEAVPPLVKTMFPAECSSGTALTYVGTVEATRRATISANNGGTLTGLSLKVGDRVSAGQILCRVESQAVSSAYSAAEATLLQAEDAYRRLKQVYDSGSVPPVKMVEIETEVAKAQAAHATARRALENCNVKAPFDGIVGEIFVVDGTELLPAAPVLSIMDPSSNEIHFQVPESELALLKVGAVASVELPALNSKFSSSLLSKGIVASRVSHSYGCVLSGNPQALPGMVCKLSFDRKDGKEKVIPASAVLTDAKGRYVWTVDEQQKVHKNYIVVSGYSGKGVIVREGLSDSLRVIVEGSRKVSSSMKVKVQE